MKVLCLYDTGVDRGECHLLIGLKQKGVEIHVICKPETARIDTLRDAGIVVDTWSIRSKIDLRLMLHIRKLVVEHDFDIVHAFRKRALSNYTLATLGLPRRPVIAYRGIIGNLSYWDPFSWITFLNPRLARIVCVCDAVRNYFLGKKFLLFFSLFNKKKVVRIYKGHRVEWYQQNVESPSVLAEMGIPENAFVIGCISRIQARKGIRELIMAMDLVRAERDVHLVVLGRIKDKSYRKALLESSCRERIHLLGFHPDAALMAREFDIITLPSLRREGLPRAIIEGMSQGVVPVVTDSGGSPELIENGVSGMIVPPGDYGALAAAFNGLLSDKSERLRMGAAAQQRIIDHFGVERTIEETYSLYNEVLEQH